MLLRTYDVCETRLANIIGVKGTDVIRFITNVDQLLLRSRDVLLTNAVLCQPNSPLYQHHRELARPCTVFDGASALEDR